MIDFKVGELIHIKGDNPHTMPQKYFDWIITNVYDDSVMAENDYGNPQVLKFNEIYKDSDLYKYQIHGINNDNKFYDSMIYINRSNLIEPEDLCNHIGEVLMFHNGSGYVVSAKLLSVDINDFDDFSYGPRYKDINYEDELDMSWYYTPNDLSAKYFTLEYAHVLLVQGIHSGEKMHNIHYISTLTEDEMKFREKILSMNKEEISKQYLELKKEVD